MINVYKLPGIDGVWSLWETKESGMVAAMPHDMTTGKAQPSGFRYFPGPMANKAKVIGQLTLAQERGLETLVHTTELHVSKVYPGGEVIQSKTPVGADIGSIAQDVKRLQSEMRKVARWTGMQYPEKGANKPEPESEPESEPQPKPKRKRKAKPEPKPEPEDLSDIPF